MTNTNQSSFVASCRLICRHTKYDLISLQITRVPGLYSNLSVIPKKLPSSNYIHRVKHIIFRNLTTHMRHSSIFNLIRPQQVEFARICRMFVVCQCRCLSSSKFAPQQTRKILPFSIAKLSATPIVILFSSHA